MKDGRVCSSNANLPAYAIEGGLPKILCIDEDALGASKTKAAVSTEGER